MRRVLVIGAGSIGERHIRCMLATGRARVSVCELRAPVREAVTQRYGLEKAFASFDEALAEKWDAAVVATPAPLHVPIALRLAEVGTHLLIEKPLSTSLEGVADLVKRVEDSGLTAAVGYVLRAHPSLAAMRAAVAGGQFGRPLALVVVAGQDFAGYRPAYRDIYYADRRQGGGAIQDAITHYFDAGAWLLGPMERVAVDAAHMSLEGVEVEDTVHAIARHAGVPASYAMNQYQAPDELSITVVCEEGTARFEYHERRWRWKHPPDGPGGKQAWHDEPVEIAGRDDWFIRQEQAFLDACEGRSPPLCSLREGIETLRANLAALASADQGGAWQTIDHGNGS